MEKETVDGIFVWINCDINNPGMNQHTEKQIIGAILGTVLEESAEEQIKARNRDKPGMTQPIF